MTEAELQATIVDAAQLAGWLVYHDHDSRRNPAGLPDLILCRPPRVVFLELKSDKGRTRPEQTIWLNALEACDTIASALIRPDNLETVIDYLTEKRTSD
jgi:hypothetical protein